jgi:dGTPase
VAEPNNRATRMMGELFHRYVASPAEMGAGSARRVDEVGLHRAVCDAIASMTDRYCIQEHHRLFGLYVGPFRPA